MACPEMSHETRSIMGDLECTLENQDVELPPIPRVPEAVLRCLTGDDCDFREIAELISEDPSTTTRVLRMANAAIWGVKVTTSIPDAVVRLGTRPLQSLMMSESLMVASRPSKKANRLIANRFWSRSLAAACITRSLAPLVKLDPEEAFVMGLLQDVGDVVVLRAVDRHEAFTHAPIETDAFEYLCYRFHESLGALVADKWSLTPKLKALLSCHHAWPETDSPNRAERLLLMLSNMITQLLGYAQLATYNLPKSRPAQDLGLADQESFVNLLTRLPDQVRERVEACN
jgi:two-component system, cell cycle response regulator